jgi:hypothetical protein
MLYASQPWCCQGRNMAVQVCGPREMQSADDALSKACAFFAAREQERRFLIVTSDQDLAARIRLQLQKQEPARRVTVTRALYFRVLLESQAFLVLPTQDTPDPSDPFYLDVRERVEVTGGIGQGSRRLSMSALALEQVLAGEYQDSDLLARYRSWANGGYEGLQASEPTRKGLVLYTVGVGDEDAPRPAL